MKRLTLLSGGEKSMTAIAFLFAVFLARPCPFYILDEVEAALDDLNITRFLELLRAHADRAQFIVVTHQKRTMEAADTLYGVSMGDDGVSKVVSRKLPREVLDEAERPRARTPRRSAHERHGKESEGEARPCSRRRPPSRSPMPRTGRRLLIVAVLAAAAAIAVAGVVSAKTTVNSEGQQDQAGVQPQDAHGQARHGHARDGQPFGASRTPSRSRGMGSTTRARRSTRAGRPA